MSELSIYKSLNNGLGGAFNTKSDLDIFIGENNYCCFYVRNESITVKRLLNLKIDCLDNTSVCIIKDGENLVLNTLSETEDLSNLTFNNDFNLNGTLLNPNNYFCFWVKLLNSSDMLSSRILNITVEYLDEY